MKKTNFFTKIFLSSALLMAAGGVQAAAFQLAEVSTSGLGRAYAGEAAIADNAGVVATNPALMSLFKTKQFTAGGVYVHSKIRMSGDVTASVVGVEAAKESANKESVVPGSLVPNMYFVAPINDKFAIGGGMNVNFGLKSEYESDYAAGVFGGKTELSAVNLNLSGSYRVTQGLSFGAGVNAVYAKAKVARNAGILDTAINNIATDSQLQAKIARNVAAAGIPSTGLMSRLGALGAQVDADTVLTHLQDKNAWGFGWNVGAVYEFNERNRIGVAYHSKIDIDFKDNTAVSYLPYGTRAHVGRGGLTLNLPDYVEVSGFHQLTDKFAMHYSYKYTKWSRLQSLHATYEDGTLANGGLAFHKDEKYTDTSRIALGATYDVNDKLALRAGIAYDESAAGENSSASIPDTDRTWYSLGATYKFTPDLSVDFGFAHLRGKKLKFTETQNIAGGLVVVKADYESRARANLYGLNVNYSF
ncbi:outer membrane protein transport protein [Caviibacterium pharyngocola]|uniref:Transporter n=1 Tax=Caviibacterium pharyngocola TaxID=28159 RepID=A0A2M8RVK8_9PAST|nr:OmpP1/FadL family transporter [Caviibacterium pharyngocola]PJG82931.1 hypothetical protein CVP04_06095 [Caviibacterium pharyngocola]